MAGTENVGERLARVETRLKAIEDDITDDASDIAAVMSKLEKIDKELSRYRGFVGGILLVVTALVTFVKMFGEQIGSFFSK